MKSVGEKEISDPPAGFAEDAPLRPLHDCAYYFISLARSCLERITHLPFPIGTIIGLVDRWTHPLTQALQCHSLYLLASIDDQIFCLVEGCGICSKVQLKMGLSQLYMQGLIGTSAGLWIKYELAVKEDIRKAVLLVDRVPLLNLVTPIFLSLIDPSARAISVWLLKQGERKSNESTRSLDSSVALILKQDVAFENYNSAVKSVQLAGPVIKSDVVDAQNDGQNEKDDVVHFKKGTILDALVKDDVLQAIKEKIVDGVLSKQIDGSVDDIVEDYALYREGVASIDDLNVGQAVCASEKIVLSHAAEVGEDYLPDVLEMLESSWLLGTSTFPRNAPTLSRRKHT